jgi:hypothetical protein
MAYAAWQQDPNMAMALAQQQALAAQQQQQLLQQHQQSSAALVLYNPGAMMMMQMQMAGPYGYYGYGYAPATAPYTSYKQPEKEDAQKQKFCAKRLTNDPLNEISDMLFKRDTDIPRGSSMRG